MATGPEAFSHCINKYIVGETDVILLSFADMYAPVKKDRSPETVADTAAGTYGIALESIVRSVLSRPDPPTVVFFNLFLWRNGFHVRAY